MSDLTDNSFFGRLPKSRALRFGPRVCVNCVCINFGGRTTNAGGNKMRRLVVLVLVALAHGRFFAKRGNAERARPDWWHKRSSKNNTRYDVPRIIMSPTVAFDDALINVHMDPVLGYLMLS